MSTKLSWAPNTTNTDGSLLTAAQLASLTYTALIDTVNPPVQSYQVPTDKITSAAGPNGATLQVNFSDLVPPFVPVANTAYFAEMTETDSAGTSQPSAVVPFENIVVPAAPLDVGVE
jgi:hypothetical protein